MPDTSFDVGKTWMEAVGRGAIRSTTVLTDERIICGRALSRGTRIDVWLEADDAAAGAPRPRARIVGGEELPIGFDVKRIGSFRLVLNRLRQIRPNAPKDPPVGRQQDFISGGHEGCPFECLHPRTPMSLHHREVLTVMPLNHAKWAVLPNANPIEPRGHVLLVPVQDNGAHQFPHRPQSLLLDDVEDLLQFQESNPGFMALYNAMHAGGTVDHIHGQAIFTGDEPLPIESAVAGWDFSRKKGGVSLSETGYPARGLVFRRDEAPRDVHRHVARLQHTRTPFNFVVTSQSMFLIARDRDHEVVPEFPSAVLASLELAGVVTTDRDAVFESATEGSIADALRRTTLEFF